MGVTILISLEVEDTFNKKTSIQSEHLPRRGFVYS